MRGTLRTRMTLPDALLVLAAGLAAGTINTVVGSGTLITFPVLLALGYPPVTANRRSAPRRSARAGSG